ncbi:hypothetical protein GCM10009624_24960 [Gordonia sinesedis]
MSVQLPMKTPPICSSRTIAAALSALVTPTTIIWASFCRNDIRASSGAPQPSGAATGDAAGDDELDDAA